MKRDSSTNPLKFSLITTEWPLNYSFTISTFKYSVQQLDKLIEFIKVSPQIKNVGISIGSVTNLLKDNKVEKCLYTSKLGKIKNYDTFSDYEEQKIEYVKQFIGVELVQ